MRNKKQLCWEARIATAGDCMFAAVVQPSCSKVKLRRFGPIFMQFIAFAVAVFAASTPAQAKHVHQDSIDFHTQETRAVGEVGLSGANAETISKCAFNPHIEKLRSRPIDRKVMSERNGSIALDFDAEMETAASSSTCMLD